MAHMTSVVSKPEPFAVLERWLAPRDPRLLVQRLDASLAALEQLEPQAWLDAAGELRLGADQVQHFLKHWLGEGYWSSGDARLRLAAFRDGLVAAYRAARAERLPCSFVWVTPEGLPSGSFAVEHVVGPHEVIVVFLTAPPT